MTLPHSLVKLRTSVMVNLPRSFESGQALLIVLLSMAVVLVLVLSILSRSITDVGVTTQGEESLRAFSAAEAGVEYALISGTSIGDTPLGQASFSADVSGFSSGEKYYVHPTLVGSGDLVTVWLVAHGDDGTLNCSEETCFTGSVVEVCWGEAGTPVDQATTPAVEIVVYYTETPGDYTTARVLRIPLDPNTARRSLNNFSAPDVGTCTIDDTDFQFRSQVDLAALGVPASSYDFENGLQFIRIRILYNVGESHPVGVNIDFPGNGILPSQGFKIESRGTAGSANRKIDVFQSFGELPPVFDAALFSFGGFSK